MVRHRSIRNASGVGFGSARSWLGRSVKNIGEQFGGFCPARYLGRRGRSGRGPDDQIGLRHIHTAGKEASDDTDLPRIACRSATVED
jgi:hypothetical protein